MSSDHSATPYLVVTGLIVLVFFGGKLILDNEGEQSLGQISAKLVKCSVAKSNKGAAGRSNSCKVELETGEIVRVVWLAQVPMNYAGPVLLEKSKGNFSGRTKYKLISSEDENHS